MLGSKPRLKMARPRLRDQVDGEPAPPGGQLVEHLAGPSTGGAGNLLQALAEPRGRQHLVGLISCGDLYSGPSSRNSIRSMASIARRSTKRAKSRGLSPTVLSLPLLAQLGDLGGLAGDDARAGRILAKDACAAAISGGR